MITDSFSGPSGDLNGRTTETGGATWVVQSGTWSTDSAGFALKNADNLFNQSAVFDAGTPNFDLSVIFGSGTGPWGLPALGGGACFRNVDNDNKWVATWNSGPSIIVYSVEAGVYTARATYSITGSDPYGKTVRVVTLGDSISVYWDGVLLGTITSNIHDTATKVGLHSYDPTFRNLDTFDGIAAAPVLLPSSHNTGCGFTEDLYTLDSGIIETADDFLGLQFRVHTKAGVQQNFVELWYLRNSEWNLFPIQPNFSKEYPIAITKDYQLPDQATVIIEDMFGYLARKNLNSPYNYVDGGYDPIVKDTRKVVIRVGRKVYTNLTVTPTSDLAPDTGTLDQLNDGQFGNISTDATNFVQFVPSGVTPFNLSYDLGDLFNLRHVVARFAGLVNTCQLPACVQWSFSQDNVTWNTLPVQPVSGNATIPGDYIDDYYGKSVEIIKTDIEYLARYLKLTITPAPGSTAIYMDETAIFGGATANILGYNLFTGIIGDSVKYNSRGELTLKLVSMIKKLQDNNSVELTLPYSQQDAADIIYNLLTNPTYWHGTGDRYDTPFLPADIIWLPSTNYSGFQYPVWQGQQASIYGYLQELSQSYGADLITDGNGRFDLLNAPYRQLTPDSVYIADHDGNGDVWDCVRDDSGKDIRNVISIKTADVLAGGTRTVVRVQQSIDEHGERFFGITDPLANTLDFREKIGTYALRDYAFRDEALNADFRPDMCTKVKQIVAFRASARPNLHAKDSDIDAKLYTRELWSIEGYDEIITPGDWKVAAQLFPYSPLGPGQPFNVSATPEALDNTKIDIVWTQPSDIDVVGALIYSSLSENGPFTQIGSLPTGCPPSTVITFIDTGLTPGATYYYYVVSIGLNGSTSFPSSIVRAVAGGAAGDDSKWTITDLQVSYVQTVVPATSDGYYEYEFYIFFTSPPEFASTDDQNFFGFKHGEYRVSIGALPATPLNKDSWQYIDEWHGDRIPSLKTWDRITDGFLYFYARFRSKTAIASGTDIYFRMWTWNTTGGLNGPAHPSNTVSVAIP